MPTFLSANVPTLQWACQFFSYFSKEKNFQLWLTFTNFKNICAVLEKLSRETKNLNCDICLFLLTCYKSCISYLSCAPLILLKKHTSCKIITKLLLDNSARHIKTERNKVIIRFLITISDLHFKQIMIQEDPNIDTYYLFCLVVLAVEKLRKPLCINCDVQKPGLFYIFSSKVGDTLMRHINLKIFLKGSVRLFQKHFASISEARF